MKKLIAAILTGAIAASLMACGGSSTSTAQPAESTKTESTAPAGSTAEAADDLVEAAKAEGTLVVYGSCEEDYLAAACENFQKLYGIEVQYQRLSTGEVQSKIEEENKNPSGDVWFGGTTDPYNVAASEGLLMPYEAKNASHLISDTYRDANGCWYGIYKGILGFMVNTDELDRMGLETPADWKDLLDEKYKGLMCVIGIGFLHDGITQIEDNGSGNIGLVIPSSGTSFEIGATAIFEGCKHPNAAKLWIEYALSPDCVELAAQNGSYQFLVIDNAKQPEIATSFGLDPDNVMEYDFEDAKENTTKYVEEVMTALGSAADDRFKTE